MRYLIIDKKPRVVKHGDHPYAITRLIEEIEKTGATYLLATTDDIEIEMDSEMKITVLGESITNFTHIILRGHRLAKPWEYETKKVLADYIDQFNKTNPDNKVLFQNLEAIKSIHYYDKLWISKVCVENNLPIIPSYYRTSGDYKSSPVKLPYIFKDFTGENDLRLIDGKEKIKKNVYLIEKEEDLNQENLVGKDTSKYISQKFITTGEDMRIFVSMGKAIGGWTRKATEGFMTVSKGEYKLVDFDRNPDTKEFAEKAAKVFKADFIAIDLMRDESGKLLLQELSFNPGFDAYENKIEGEKANIAQSIIQSFGK